MPKLLTATVATAVAALALSGCGDSSMKSTVSSVSESATGAMSSMASSMSSMASSAAAPASAAAGSLAAACPQIDAIMEANPDSDPAGTAQKLEAVKGQVTTPDADLIEALAAAYAAIAANPNVPADQPEGQQMTTALSDSAKAMGAACQTATGTPTPN